MKKRNRARRQHLRASRTGARGILGGARKRKCWTFEHLEDRHYFSVAPFDYQPGADGLLNAEQVSLNELYWSVKQAGVLSKYDPALLASNTQWVVLTNAQGAALGAGGASGTAIDTNFSTALTHFDTTGLSLEQVLDTLQNNENVLGFYPMIPQKSASASNASLAMLDEPLFPLQWHLQNTGGVNIGNPDFQEIFGVPGEDINVVPAWGRGYTGAGVIVAVVDSGIEVDHPDLVDNINLALGTIIAPLFGDAHGTAVAGLIAADADNGYGGTGVAPNAQIVPMSFAGVGDDFVESQIFAYRNDVIDVYNHSWDSHQDGSRSVNGLGPLGFAAVRQSIVFGRPVDGIAKGVIHVFATGNSNGHFGSPGFPNPGQYYDSATFNSFVNRYTIGVGGIDHDGKYFNVDGTLTNYPETGPNVLVVAPTGSNALNISIDTGLGSGIFTTDLTGDEGYNSGPLPNGFEIDADFLENTDFTSRFNGTSAAAPLVTGVVALMLEANPQLNYRDVQEILMRSARYVDPTNEGWEVNLLESFQDPAGFGLPLEDPFVRVDQPVNAVTLQNAFGFGFPSNIGLKPIDDYTYQSLPQFTNGAGYSVNYARGIFQEETGWAHGVVDADLAVRLAEQWHTRGQDNRPEVTYTSFVRPLGGTIGVIKAAEFSGPQGNPNLFVIPGSFGDGDREFGAYYDEFWADEPFSGDDPPGNDRGIGLFIGASSASALPFRWFPGFTPPLMEIEWVELKVEASGDAGAFNELRLAIKSPDGTISDLTHFLENNTSLNMNNIDKEFLVGGASSYAEEGNLVWTFSTNRHWGERSDDVVEIDPTTGEPRVDPDNTGMFPGRFYLDTVNVDAAGNATFADHITHNWEIIAENYSGGDILISRLEFVFHGQRLPENSERIQGKIGVDRDQDGNFNYFREMAPQNDVNGDGVITELDNDIVDATGLFGAPDGIIDIREIDAITENPEKFGEGLVVQAFDHSTGQLVAEFVTGADGNFYFDLVNNDVQATTGTIQAQNTTFTVATNSTGDFGGAAGNNITVSFVMDPTVIGAVAQLNGTDIEVLVQNQTVPWMSIEAAIEAINGGGHFDVSVSTPSATFAAADESIVATLTGGIDGAYDIMVEPASLAAANLIAKDDAGLDPRYRSVWTVRIDPTDNFTRNAGREVPQDTNRDGIQDFVDSNMNGIQDPGELAIFRYEEFRDVNFLLDPGTPPDPNLSVSGFVFADVNGNGVVDGTDTRASNFRVFIDLNQSGQFELGEPVDLVEVGENGEFALSLPVTAPTSVTIRAQSLLQGWTPTVPVGGRFTVFGGPGDSFEGIQFGFRPPVGSEDPNPDPGPIPGDDPGVLLGSVYDDRDRDGVRDFFEPGVGGIQVYVDLNQDGDFDAGEPGDITDNSGAFFIDEVPVGPAQVRIVTPNAWALTSPASGFRAITMVSGGTISNIVFGLENLATHDFGDLPDSFQTLAASGGPSHLIVPGFRLGLRVDGELDGQPSSDAQGDDNQVDDEDGVVVISSGGVLRGGPNTLQVTVFGVGGLLTGWIDWNDNQQFDAGERIQWTDSSGNPVGELHLNPGTHTLVINGPVNLVDGDVAARFRWGSAGLSFNGAAGAGEVEDYILPYSGFALGDYTRNGIVDQDDYNLWRATFGMAVAPGSGADGNRNGEIDLADWAVWRKALSFAAGGSVAATGGESTSSAVSVTSAPAVPTEPLLAGLGSNLISAPLAVTASITRGTASTLAADDANVDLLLLDAVWADSASDEEAFVSGERFDERVGEDDGLTDLALAAVFEEENDWQAVI